MNVQSTFNPGLHI